MTINPPPALPRSPAGARAPGCEVIVATAVSSSFADDGDVLLIYRLDDGAERSIKLPHTAPVPRPDQPILLFLSSDCVPARFTTLPFGRS